MKHQGLFFVVVLFGLAAVTFGAWSCSPLKWTLPMSWYAGNLRAQTKYTQGCSQLVTMNELHRCKLVGFVECENNTQCPSGQLCGDGMVPRLCVECSPSVTNTWYEYANITTNVTQAMLGGKFWNTDSFYNHTGVDLILDLARWSWSPSGNALDYDSAQQKRTTWGDRYDSEWFRSETQRYTDYNSTHVKCQYGSIWRNSYDNGDGYVETSGGTIYYPKSQQ